MSVIISVNSRSSSSNSFREDLKHDLFFSSPTANLRLVNAASPNILDSPEVERLVQERDEAKNVASQLQLSLNAVTEIAKVIGSFVCPWVVIISL